MHKNISALTLAYSEDGRHPSNHVTFVGEYAEDRLLTFVRTQDWGNIPLGTRVLSGTVDQCLRFGGELRLATNPEEFDKLFYRSSNIRPDLRDLRVVEMVEETSQMVWHVVGGKPWKAVADIEEGYNDMVFPRKTRFRITVTTLGNTSPDPVTIRLGLGPWEAARIFQVDLLDTSPQPPVHTEDYEIWRHDLYIKHNS